MYVKERVCLQGKFIEFFKGLDMGKKDMRMVLRGLVYLGNGNGRKSGV